MKNLTARQLECLEYISQGIPRFEIARKLWVEDTTVDNHLIAAYKKLSALNAPHAVRIAMERGLFSK